jgi:hypothetical protein
MYKCLDSEDNGYEHHRYFGIPSGEILQITEEIYERSKVNLLLDMQTHLKKWDEMHSSEPVNISVSAVDPIFIFFRNGSFCFEVYGEDFKYIRSFTTCDTESGTDDDAESHIMPELQYTDKTIDSDDGVLYTDTTIDSEDEIAYSQYKHIGFLDITGLVVIYDVYGNKVSQWNASVIDVNHTEKKLSYQLIMLPDNFLVIIEQSNMTKNEYLVGNLHFYSIFGKKYKMITLRDIIGESVIMRFMTYYESVLYTLVRNQLTIVYDGVIYVVPVF